MKTRLSETQELLADKISDGTFPIRLITEGEGSSGVYSKEMLQANAHVFSKGTKSFVDHPKDPSKPWERSLTSIVGTLAEDAVYKEVDGVGGLYSRLKVSKDKRDWVEDFSDVLECSIYADAFGEKNGDGKVVVEAFDDADPYRSVDLVIAGGRGGRIEKAMESYREIDTSDKESENGSAPAGGRTTESKEIPQMEIEELAGKIDKLTESLSSFVEVATPVLEALKPVEKTDEVDLATAVEAVVEAKLPKTSRVSVLEAFKSGVKIEDAIKSESDRVEELRKELVAESGFASNGANGTAEYSIAKNATFKAGE